MCIEYAPSNVHTVFLCFVMLWLYIDFCDLFTHILQHCHDDVIKWNHFPSYWPFVRGIHRSAVNSPHKGQWRGALMFSLICAWINGWVNSRKAGDLRRHRAHYDVIVMIHWRQGLYSLSGRTSYRKISWSLDVASFEFKLVQSLWNVTGTSAAVLPKRLSNFRAIQIQIRLFDIILQN